MSKVLKLTRQPLVKDKSPKIKFKDYFYNNVNIFEVAGKKPYEVLSADEYNKFCENVDRWIAVANIWRTTEEGKQKILDLNDALEELKSIFKYEKLTKDYSAAIRKNLYNELARNIYSKFRIDKVLDVSELLDAMDYAISIKFTDDREFAKKKVTEIIQILKKKYNFEIESYEDTFLKLIAKKDKIELLDTDLTKQKLFKEYKPLAELNYQVSLKELPSDETLYEEMVSLLAENSVLIPNTDFFMLAFLEPEIERQSGHYDFNYPINTEYFYYLKGTAINVYQLSEDQWRGIALIRGIVPEDSATVAFIMGYQKESSVAGITKLLKDNPETAKNRILAGDLETYFSHIGRKNISLKIGKLKETYKTNTDELVTGVVELLKSGTGGTIEIPTVPREKKTFDKLVQKNGELKDFVSFIVKNKSDELLINEISTDSITVERLQSLLLAKKKKTTYVKFLLNVMNELLLETDITQYKYAFIKVSSRTQKELIDQSDAISFINIYSVLVNSAITNGIIQNSDEIQNFTEAENTMNSIYDALLNSSKESKNKKKSKFSNLFHKGEK